MESSRLSPPEAATPFLYPAVSPAPAAKLAKAVIELLFAAKDLAGERLVAYGPPGGETRTCCLECFASAPASAKLPHARLCKTGRTLAAIERVAVWAEAGDISQSTTERRSSEEQAVSTAAANSRSGGALEGLDRGEFAGIADLGPAREAGKAGL